MSGYHGSKIKFTSEQLRREVNRIISIGQAASLLGVAPRTVTKYTDGGKLKAFRLPTIKTYRNEDNEGDPIGDRRIYLNDLLDFMRKIGMRIDPVMDANAEIISYGLNQSIENVKQFDDLFELGIYLGNVRQLARTVIFGTGYGVDRIKRIYQSVTKHHPRMIVITVFDSSEQTQYNEWNIGDRKVITPFDYAELLEYARDYIRIDTEALDSEQESRKRQREKRKRDAVDKWQSPNTATLE